MSPEQLQEGILGRSYSSRPVDGRSDVFSLGVILFELLTGKHPFGEIPRWSDPREAAKELVRRHECGPLGWEQSVRPAEREIVRFLDSCLAPHPDQRPPTAEAAAAVLRGFLTRKSRFQRWRKVHRRALAAAAGVLLTASVATGAAVALRPPASQRWLTEAQEHIARQDWQAAEAALNQALATDHASAHVWELLGKVERQQKNYRDAFFNFKRAYELSREPGLLAEMGHCKYKVNEFVEAEGWYQKSTAEGYASAELFTNLGYCLLAKGHVEKAQSLFDQAVAMDSTWLEARIARAEMVVSSANKPDLKSAAPRIVEDARVIASRPRSYADVILAAALLTHLPPTGNTELEIRTLLETARAMGAKNSNFRLQRFGRFYDRAWFEALCQN
jgi:tetratricopeptide (TPR) repeat protein